MLCKDALLRVIQRQTEGLMYHDEMTDYYAFLHLDVLKELHHKQTKEELCALREVKCDYIKTFESLPFYIATDPKVIPIEWKNKTVADVDEASLKILIKDSLAGYLDWERETCEIYKSMALVFKENMNFYLHRKVCKMIEEVQEEIHCINEMIVDAASYDYCPSYFK